MKLAAVGDFYGCGVHSRKNVQFSKLLAQNGKVVAWIHVLPGQKERELNKSWNDLQVQLRWHLN